MSENLRGGFFLTHTVVFILYHFRLCQRYLLLMNEYITSVRRGISLHDDS